MSPGWNIIIVPIFRRLSLILRGDPTKTDKEQKTLGPK